jgi:hypothetical protein
VIAAARAAHGKILAEVAGGRERHAANTGATLAHPRDRAAALERPDRLERLDVSARCVPASSSRAVCRSDGRNDRVEHARPLDLLDGRKTRVGAARSREGTGGRASATVIARDEPER